MANKDRKFDPENATLTRLTDLVRTTRDELRKPSYSGFVPKERRAETAQMLDAAVRFIESHPVRKDLPTRLFFPDLEGSNGARLAMFLQRNGYQFLHRILLADPGEVLYKLYHEVGLAYPEVFLDMRKAYERSREKLEYLNQ